MECGGVIGVLFFHTLGITHLLEQAIIFVCPFGHVVLEVSGHEKSKTSFKDEQVKNGKFR